MSAPASGAAAAAAAAAAARRAEEEEMMTPYTQQDLADDWEFKILRSATGMFKHPDKLRKVLDEEAQAGWKLVEKFDNGRIRLKRPQNAREKDGSLGFDPYRTTVGPSEAGIAFLIVGGILAIVAIGIIIAAIANG